MSIIGKECMGVAHRRVRRPRVAIASWTSVIMLVCYCWLMLYLVL